MFHTDMNILTFGQHYRSQEASLISTADCYWQVKTGRLVDWELKPAAVGMKGCWTQKRVAQQASQHEGIRWSQVSNMYLYITPSYPEYSCKMQSHLVEQ